ncbi:MAG TPA: cysteine desulfurase family protein [Gemmataceae bacterium]|nr:cysteine desulfurase family protein [Gemmataceae bacterium]
MDPIYLDNNATTPLLPAVWEAMRPFAVESYGNPASVHQFGRRARRGLEDAREQTAALLGAHPDEVIFTSGATEANNLALFGQSGDPPACLLASPIEHPSVAEPLRQLSAAGFVLEQLPVNAEGVVGADLPAGINPAARLATVMLVNHETGAIQPVRQLAEQLAHCAAFHCDATQAVGKIPVHFHGLGVTSLALSAHKFHGPKGVGALLLRRGAQLRPRTWGGHQQRGRRPGTEPAALAVGLAAALQLVCRDMDRRTAVVRSLRERFWTALRDAAGPLVLNGPSLAPLPGVPGRGAREPGCVPHTLNLSFPGLKADALLMALDLAGVACSAGSACSSGSLLPSPVLRAMGASEEVLQSAVRFSLSAQLTPEEIDEAVRRIASVVHRLRRQPQLVQV